MANLIIIMTGLVFALLGYRKTWHPSWVFLFNVIIAVYISIMASPQVVETFPVIRNNLGNFSYAGLILVAAVVIFVALNLFSFRYFTSVSTVPFPKILDNAGAAVLGFLAGSVIAGFLLFIVTITPLSRYSFVRTITQSGKEATNVNCAVIACCGVVHDISLQPIPEASEKQFEWIVSSWNRTVETNKPRQVNKPADSNTAEPLERESENIP